MDGKIQGASSAALEEVTSTSSGAEAKEFFPKGAIAFFGILLGAFGLIWLGLYLLVLQRQFGL